MAEKCGRENTTSIKADTACENGSDMDTYKYGPNTTVELVVAWADALSPTVTALTGTWRAKKILMRAFTCSTPSTVSAYSGIQRKVPQLRWLLFTSTHQVCFINSFLFLFFSFYFNTLLLPYIRSSSYQTQPHHTNSLIQAQDQTGFDFLPGLMLPPLPPGDCEKIHPHVPGAQPAYWHKQT